MSKYPDSNTVREASDWLEQAGTIDLVYEASLSELMSAKYVSGMDRIKFFGPMVNSLDQLGRFLLVRHFISEDKRMSDTADGIMGYFLLTTSRLLRLQLVTVVSTDFKGSKRKQSLSGPFYTPYITQEDTLAILLALSINDTRTAITIATAFVDNEAVYDNEIERPPITLPTVALSFQLTTMLGCDTSKSKYAVQTCDIYNDIISTFTGDCDWRTAFDRLCRHCEMQSLSDDEYYSEFYSYPYRIYPVTQLAVATLYKLLVPNYIPQLPYTVRAININESYQLLGRDLYTAVCNLISSGFPNFQFPLIPTKGRRSTNP